MTQDLAACVRLFEQGQIDQAHTCCKTVLKRAPGDAQATHFLGLMEHLSGNNNKAEKTLKKALKLAPNDPHVHHNYGLVLNELGRESHAMAAFRKALKIAPDYPDAAYSLGALEVKNGDPKAGIEHLSRAVPYMPDNPGVHSWLGVGFLHDGRYAEAHHHLKRALELDPDNLEALLSWSALPPHVAPEAEGYILRAAKLAPESLAVLEMCAHWMERRQDMAQARTYAERALAIDPRSVRAQTIMARIERAEGDNAACRKRLEQVIETVGDPKASVLDETYSDLGQVLNRMGEYDAAFDAFTAMNDIAGQTPQAQRLDVDEVPRRLADVRAWLEAGLAATIPDAPPGAELDPIFFLPFPRAGSTLMEQILASHSSLQSAGEIPAMGIVYKDLQRMRGEDFSYVRDLSSLSPDDVCELRAVFWNKYAKHLEHNPAERRVVDKVPLNLINFPLISLLFPNAKVLMALRDPRDTCLSNVMQLFNMNFGMIHMLNFDRATALYAQYGETWQACRDHSDMALYEYRYEDLVTNFEDTLTHVLDFLDLPWDEAVHDYMETAKGRAIHTPSYTGVMKQLNTKAVGRWKNYEKHMRPYLDRLEPFIEAYGYPQ